ncbi:MAG: T9SS type A sorting domain-containing protein, partial [Aliifodinibius sp.]|nr:T9SS type A sorting domain-containing protein [candidate division Zixibacteria bacterium]NIT56357.1 T9SS type A sorting domain-containing protein [Fodinibius sp.]NIW44438.1 T9SS type A sorting domain-containing protein [Gammaproteobacteria bacterium]NIS45451.1 T9SS type A sorting domain-containing protein [candidate division Zixibacteria bacterium]NIU13591.1 T9SS type A sorting domain-containing protein [candidate division Zixibacteria bacterium]
IRYSLPKSAHVTLKIYNSVGQEVKTLVDQSQSAGFKSVQWDATNRAGQTVSSGIYLYKIQAGDFVQIRKMVLLR